MALEKKNAWEVKRQNKQSLSLADLCTQLTAQTIIYIYIILTNEKEVYI